MDWGNIGTFFSDNWQGLAQTGLGVWDAYQGYQAGQSASDFYDAAGETAKERWAVVEDLEKKRVAREMDIMDLTLPLQEQALGLQGQQMDFQEEILPQYQDYSRSLMDFQEEMLPEQIALAKQNLGLQSDYLDTARGDIEQYEQFRPLEEKFYTEAMEGKDIGEAMGEAQADVAAGYQGAAGARRRSATRMGLNPNSGAFQAASKDMALNQAKDIAGARNMARRQTEDINFNRLSTGLTARQRLGQPQMQPSSYGLQAPQISTSTPNYQANTAGPIPDIAGTFASLGNVAAQGATGARQEAGYWLNKGLNSF